MSDIKLGDLDAQSEPSPLSRWDDEGEIPELTNTELVQLRVRVIALENLVVALLSGAADRQNDLIRAMAIHISPRQGVTPHPLTIQAASQMVELVERAAHYRDALPE